MDPVGYIEKYITLRPLIYSKLTDIFFLVKHRKNWGKHTHLSNTPPPFQLVGMQRGWTVGILLHPPKFNIAPEKWWLEDNPLLLGCYIFRGELLNFHGVVRYLFLQLGRRSTWKTKIKCVWQSVLVKPQIILGRLSFGPLPVISITLVTHL